MLRDTQSKSLLLFLIASLVLHVLAVLAIRMPQRHRTEPEILQVQLERIEPPRMLSRPEPPPPPPERRPLTPKPPPVRHEAPRPERIVKAPAPSPPREEPRSEPRILAVPTPAAVPERSFSVPQPPADAPAVEAKSEPAPREITRAPSTAAPPAEKPAPYTAPSIDAAYLQTPKFYPRASIRNGEEGTVMVKVLVTRDGRVGTASVATSSGFPRLDQAALEQAKQYRFTPARRGNEPVEAYYTIPVVFRLEPRSS